MCVEMCTDDCMKRTLSFLALCWRCHDVCKIGTWDDRIMILECFRDWYLWGRGIAAKASFPWWQLPAFLGSSLAFETSVQTVHFSTGSSLMLPLWSSVPSAKLCSTVASIDRRSTGCRCTSTTARCWLSWKTLGSLHFLQWRHPMTPWRSLPFWCRRSYSKCFQAACGLIQGFVARWHSWVRQWVRA